MNVQSVFDRALSIGRLCAVTDEQGPAVGHISKTANWKSIIAGIFFGTICVLGAPPVFADHGGTAGGVCMADRYNGDRLVIADGENPSYPGAPVSSLGCTSNDVELAVYVLEDGPAGCIEGQEIQVRLRGEFTSGSNERYDVGLFIAEGNNDPSVTGGSCWSNFLHPTSADNLDLDLTGGAGPFYNGEITEDSGDTCGDIEQNQPAGFVTDWITMQCQDSDDDGTADVASCTVWSNSTSNGSGKPSCNDELDVSAKTTAKCTCDNVNIIGLAFSEFGTIEVVKNLIPDTDPGLFNLYVDATTPAVDVGHDGTTTPQLLGAGTNVEPGEIHTVGETAGTGTSLLSYDSEISCVNRGLSTFHLGEPLVLGSAGPLDVLVLPEDDIVCTITNTSICASAVCSNSACASFACDPLGAAGNCDTMLPFPQDTECRVSGGACDPNEVCDGINPTCPADVLLPAETECRASGGACDPNEVCDGSNATCPADVLLPAETECRASGGACDPNEVCDGSNVECPADVLLPAETECRASGGACDPNEACDGSNVECPADVLLPAETECRASGGACDPNEVCDGSNATCPADVLLPAETECRASGGACDPNEVCDGSNVECPADVLLPAETECRASGGACDPNEVCDGSNVECPADVLLPAETECRASGGACDPNEVCDGSNVECPADVLLPAETECRASAGACDPNEVCDGNNAACPTDLKDSTTVCRAAGICDAEEICDGVSNDCPADLVAEQGTICSPSVSGDEICDPPEVCDGETTVCPGPPEANIAEEGTACGNQTTTACTQPDTCDGDGFCQNNNEVCGSVTDSALCEYDMEPTKGTCDGGSADGGACFIDNACQQGGGTCEYDEIAQTDLCMGGSDDGLDCTIPTQDACVSGGGACFNGQCSGGSYDGTACCIAGGGMCRQSDQFRLLFSPDIQNWPAYRINASNPGQTYYNVIYDAKEAYDNGEDVTLTVTVPYPYVTVGGMPLHVYDDVALDSADCYVPDEAIMSEPMFITLDDWIHGAIGAGDYNLNCTTVVDPGGSGSCSFEVFVPNLAIPEHGLLYVNLHLDYGLKGQWVDANPYGNYEDGTFEDRYDRSAYISPWSSSDALVDTTANDGPLAIADCTGYWFEHTDDVNAGVCVGGADGGSECQIETDACAEAGGVCNIDTCEGGDLDTQACTPIDCSDGGGTCVATPLFDDSVENLNVFKKISGMFGRISCGDDGVGFGYYLDLARPGNNVVATAKADDEGHYIFDYRHKGKPTEYTVNLYEDEARTIWLASTVVILQGNGWWEVSFTATDCGDELLEDWTGTVTYGSGRYKK